MGLTQEEFRKGSAQFIISTHSPILGVSGEEAEIFSFDRPSISRVALKETSHYQVLIEFIQKTGLTVSTSVEKTASPSLLRAPSSSITR
ncbi:MAG: hypothetical protein R2860_00235 [Desulfobacterales bacterium]